MKCGILTSLMVFLGVLIGISQAYDWPTRPFTKQDSIWSTLGEMRDSAGVPHHFHAGVDIRQSNGDTVFSMVDSGIVHEIGTKYFWIDNYQYYHVTLLPTISDSDTVVLHQPVATILELNHLHFRERSNTSPPYNALNPLRPGALTPYVDSTRPHIYWIRFYDRDTGDVTLADSISSDSIKGKVDILSSVLDTRTDSLGHSPLDTGGVAIYKIGYQVIDTLGSILRDWLKIKFDTIPNPSDTSRLNCTYGPGSIFEPPRFRYWVSNDPFNSNSYLRNWYWNTKQKLGEPDSVDADSIEDAKFKDGYYWVKVIAADIRNNADTESVKVCVANFQPKVKQTNPTKNTPTL